MPKLNVKGEVGYFHRNSPACIEGLSTSSTLTVFASACSGPCRQSRAAVAPAKPIARICRQRLVCIAVVLSLEPCKTTSSAKSLKSGLRRYGPSVSPFLTCFTAWFRVTLCLFCPQSPQFARLRVSVCGCSFSLQAPGFCSGHARLGNSMFLCCS